MFVFILLCVLYCLVLNFPLFIDVIEIEYKNLKEYIF